MPTSRVPLFRCARLSSSRMEFVLVAVFVFAKHRSSRARYTYACTYIVARALEIFLKQTLYKLQGDKYYFNAERNKRDVQ